METARRIHVIEDPRFMDHAAPQGHPEREERLIAVSQALKEFETANPGSLERIDPRAATDDEILRVHSRGHLDLLQQSTQRAPINLDPDTYLSPQSFSVARLAAGSCIDLALRVADGSASCGFAALRPPGHHAEATRAMGFCLLNSVAIAARALQVEAGVDKLMILDWDVHHGNGTQHSFEADPSILYVSTHQFPFYPGTGAAGEAGQGKGRGATLNIPLPAGCGDSDYVGVFAHILVPVVEEFAPEMILVSCGFDAHESDPLASMRLTGAGYLAMTRVVRELADRLCGGRIAFVLEGGYAAEGLIEGTTAVLSGLREASSRPLSSRPQVEPGSNLSRVVSEVAAVHGSTYRNISTS
jgi:acetoin utilization deacetylase AcuC-like enzyme